MRERYQSAKSRQDKSQVIDQVCDVLKCHRKHAIRALNQREIAVAKPIKGRRPLKYQNAIPAIHRAWEALDYPCAKKRLHPVLLETVEHLAMHDEVYLDDQIRQELAAISRSTLSRRLATMRSPKPKRNLSRVKLNGKLRSEVPVDRYDSTRAKPGALEVDLVEHNGGNSLGHFAYTLTVVDVVTQYSRRRAVLVEANRA